MYREVLITMILEIILFTLMTFCIIYPIVICIYSGWSGFLFFWFILAVVLYLWATFHKAHRQEIFKLTPSIFISFYALLGILAFLFIFMEFHIFSSMNNKATPGAEYIIVLGDRVIEDEPSKTLEQRLNAAYEYWKNNKNAVIILSGGQADDDIAQSIVMRSYLMRMGVDSTSIIMEDESVSVFSSILNSVEYINNTKSKTVVIASDYNAFRALQFLKNQGYENSEVIATKSDKVLWLNYMVREAFALTKDILLHGLKL